MSTSDPVKCRNCKEAAWLEKEDGVLTGYRCYSCESFFPLMEKCEKHCEICKGHLSPVPDTMWGPGGYRCYTCEMFFQSYL